MAMVRLLIFWYDALLDIGVDQGTFSIDKDTLIDIENIVGTDLNDTLVALVPTSSKLVLAGYPHRGSW